MKCPRCGAELVVDEHRKMPLGMCYSCGYIEGRATDEHFASDEHSNFRHMKGLSMNETIAFLHKGLGVDEEKLAEFLEEVYKE